MNSSPPKKLDKALTKRKVSADYLFANLSDEQFETVYMHLRLGDLSSKAYVSWVAGMPNPVSKLNSIKCDLDSKSWKYFALNLPMAGSGDGGVYLMDYDSDQIHTDISLDTSEVNRILNLTAQGGGQPPKMSPRLYAFLTVRYAHRDFEESAEDIFSILEEKPDLWGESGVIEDRRGLKAIREFLAAIPEFESQLDEEVNLNDISIASSV